MTRELRDSGLAVGRRRIARLMRDNGLRARQKRRFNRTTDSHHAWPLAPNLLDQDFTATGPDKKVTGRFGPPYGAGFGRVVYVVSDVVMDVVNEVSDAPGGFDGARASP